MNILSKLGYQKKLYIFLSVSVIPLFFLFFMYDVIPEWLLFFVMLSLFVLLPVFFIIVMKASCPKCKQRILWDFLNGKKEHRHKVSPFISDVCPNCGFDPQPNHKD